MNKNISFDEIPPSKRKDKRVNFNSNEINHLMTCVFNEINILENKKTDAVSLKEKTEAWQRISMNFNSNNLINRDINSLKIKYDNIKRNLKKKVSYIKREKNKTGGGPPIDPELEWYEEKLYFILKINIDGLEPIADSDAMYLQGNKIQEVPTQVELLDSASPTIIPESILEPKSVRSDCNLIYVYNDSEDDQILFANETADETLINMPSTSTATPKIKHSDINEVPSTAASIKPKNGWNLKKRKRITTTKIDKQNNLDDFKTLAEKKTELVEIQKKCYSTDLNEREKSKDRKDEEWDIKKKCFEVDLKIKEEAYNEMLRDRARKEQMFELEKARKEQIFALEMEEKQLKIDNLTFALNAKLKNL